MIDPIPFADWSSNPLATFYNAIVAVMTAVPVGLYFARRARTQSHISTTWIVAILASGLFVVALEIAQIFIESRTASADDMIWSAAGAVLGVLGSRYLASDETHERKSTGSSQRALAFGMGLIALGFIHLIDAWVPFDVIDSGDEIRRRVSEFFRSPIASMQSGSDLVNISSLIRAFLWSMPLGGLATLTTGSTSKPLRFTIAVLSWTIVVSVCFATEAGQLFLRQRTPSLIAIISQILGCLFGGWIATRLVSRRYEGL